MNEYYDQLHAQALYAAKIFALVKYDDYDVWYVEFRVTRRDVFKHSQSRWFLPTHKKEGYECEIVVCSGMLKQYNTFEAFTIAKEINRGLPERDRLPFSGQEVGEH